MGEYENERIKRLEKQGAKSPKTRSAQIKKWWHTQTNQLKKDLDYYERGVSSLPDKKRKGR